MIDSDLGLPTRSNLSTYGGSAHHAIYDYINRTAFQIGAVGNISTNGTFDYWSMKQNKLLTNVNSGI